MTISVRILKSWTFDEDSRGEAKITYPKGLVFGLDDDLALVGIAQGFAEPVNPLGAEQVDRLGAIRKALAGEIPIEDALAPKPASPAPAPAVQPEPTGDDATGDEPVAAKRRGKAK